MAKLSTLFFLAWIGPQALAAPMPNAPLGILKDPAPKADSHGVLTIEFGYEERAPVVFGKRATGEVLLKREAGGDVWVKPQEKAEVTTFEQLLEGNYMTYFTQNWDTRLYSEATRKADFSKRSAFRLPARKLPRPTSKRPYTSSRDVEVLERQTVDGALWLKVKLIEESSCATKDGKPVYAKHPVTGKWLGGCRSGTLPVS